MARRNGREAALKALYEREFHAGAGPFPEQDLTQKEEEYLGETVNGVLSDIENIDSLIGRYSQGWTVGRMALVDRNILRLAVYEILLGDIPGSVAISEAVELAREYSTDEAAPFINGILGSFLRSRETGS